VKASEILRLQQLISKYGIACFQAGVTLASDVHNDEANDTASAERSNAFREVAAELAKYLKV